MYWEKHADVEYLIGLDRPGISWCPELHISSLDGDSYYVLDLDEHHLRTLKDWASTYYAQWDTGAIEPGGGPQRVIPPKPLLLLTPSII